MSSLSTTCDSEVSEPGCGATEVPVGGGGTSIEPSIGFNSGIALILALLHVALLLAVSTVSGVALLSTCVSDISLLWLGCSDSIAVLLDSDAFVTATAEEHVDPSESGESAVRSTSLE